MVAYYPSRKLKGFRCPKRAVGYPMSRQLVETWIAKLAWTESFSLGLTDQLLFAREWLTSRQFSPWTAYTDVVPVDMYTNRYVVRYFFSDPLDAVEFTLRFS
jgi:hypothetical protein